MSKIVLGNSHKQWRGAYCTPGVDSNPSTVENMEVASPIPPGEHASVIEQQRHEKPEDFARAVQLLQVAHSRNCQLRETFSELRGWYTELSAAHQVLKEQYIQLQHERDTVEHQYQQLCDGWRVELEAKQAAFDEARSQILSQRDLDTLKSRVIAECEKPWLDKCAKLQQEAERAQKELVNARQGHALNASRLEQQVLSLNAKFATASSQQTAQVQELRGRLQQSEQRADQLLCNDRNSKQALQQRDNLLGQLRHINHELEDARAAQQSAEAKLARCQSDSSEAVARAESACLEMKHQVSTLQARAHALQAELQQAEASNKRLSEQATRSAVDCSQSKQQLNDCQQAHAIELHALEEALHSSEAQSKEQAESSARDLAEERQQFQAQLTAVQSELTITRESVAVKVGLAEETLRAQIHGLQVELRAERARGSAVKENHLQQAEALTTQLKKCEHSKAELQQEVSALREQLMRAQGQVTSLLATNNDQKQNMDHLGCAKADVEQQLRDSQALVEQLKRDRDRMDAGQVTSSLHSKLHADLATVCASFEAAKSSAQEVTSELKRAQVEHKRAIEQLNEKADTAQGLLIRKLKAKHDGKLASLRADAQRLKATIHELESKMVELADKNCRLETRLLELQVVGEQKAIASQDAPCNSSVASTLTLLQFKSRLDLLRARQQPYLSLTMA